MMIAGIVCEYNPFHNGHLYHINKVRENGADFIVCVMSGNFVQRGECAVLDKWKRAEIAVRCGADVVIDLPTPWACASAETFARGSIGLLCDFGVDVVSFGCETDDRELLMQCVEAQNDERVVSLMKRYMSEGLTYPKALSMAVEKIYSKTVADIISSPNSTLAAEYIKAVSFCGRQIDIMPILRVGADHDSSEIQSGFASASFLRSRMLDNSVKDYVPQECFDVIENEVKKGFAPCSLSVNERAALSSLRELKKDEYNLYVSDENGLASRIYEAVKKAKSLDELYRAVKVKNYTHSRIRREIMMLYLRCPKQMCVGTVPYMKILAASEKGLSLLKNAKENSSVPMITKHSESDSLNEKGKAVYDFECLSSDKFALFSKEIRACALEATHSLKVVR